MTVVKTASDDISPKPPYYIKESYALSRGMPLEANLPHFCRSPCVPVSVRPIWRSSRPAPHLVLRLRLTPASSLNLIPHPFARLKAIFSIAADGDIRPSGRIHRGVGGAAGDAQEKRCWSGIHKPRMGACGWQTANAGGTDTAPVWALPAARPAAPGHERSRTLTGTHGERQKWGSSRCVALDFGVVLVMLAGEQK